MMNEFEVSIVGRVYIDHVFAGFDQQPAIGTEIYCKSYQRTIGGGTAITAYWLGKMGRHVQVACVVGQDDVEWFRDEFGSVGVTTDLMQASVKNTGVTAAISLDNDREYFTNLGANEELEKYLDDDRVLWRLCRSTHLHMTIPLSRDIAKRLIQFAHQSGLTVSLDVGYQPQWYCNPQNHATLQEVDFLFLNEVEAELLGLTSRITFNEWFKSYTIKTLQPKVRWVVVKQGGAEAIAVSVGSYVTVKPPVVNSLDSTGAGEAFNAGFIDSILNGGDAKDWLMQGCVCGALSVQKLGGIAAATGNEQINMMKEKTYGI